MRKDNHQRSTHKWQVVWHLAMGVGTGLLAGTVLIALMIVSQLLATDPTRQVPALTLSQRAEASASSPEPAPVVASQACVTCESSSAQPIVTPAPPDDAGEQPSPTGQGDSIIEVNPTTAFLPGLSKNAMPPARQCSFSVGIWPSSKIPQQVAQAQELGVCWMRVNFYWDRIEPVKTNPRSYDWQTVDTPVLSLTMAGIQPLGLVLANPAWAAAYPGGPVTDTQDMLDFLVAAAERYDGDGISDAPGSPLVSTWEMYNEPDNQWEGYAVKRGWGYWGGQGEAYAQFLAQARQAIRSANPEARLAFGGLAHEDIGSNIYDLDFPATVFGYIRDHPGEYFDLFNFHFFPLFGSVYKSWGPDIIGKANHFRELMEQHGQSWPMIVTEAGYWSYSDALPQGWQSGYEEQARYVPQLYSRSAAAGLEFTSWLLLFDLPVHDAQRGLSDVDGVPKPAFNAYKTMTTRLGNARFERTLSAEELGGQKAEGYVFTRESKQIYVVWASKAKIKVTLKIEAASVTVSDKLAALWPMSPTLPYFETFSVTDAEDGVNDGYVKLSLDDNPIYIEIER